jgi:hypothetical protein
MRIAAGLVGLPNVGKSTLFNALTRSNVPAANYPFCTIEPHTACTAVPDHRLEELLTIYQSKKIIPAYVSFVDIAGLVEGAASGAGLGNQFLNNIRDVSLIVHVIRCFEDASITHTSTTIDPIRDYDIIMTELMIKDLESLTKRQLKLANLIKGAQSKPSVLQELKKEETLINQLIQSLDTKKLEEAQALIEPLAITESPRNMLLSTKPFLIIANISENEIAQNRFEENQHYQALINRFGTHQVIPISAKLEGDISVLPDDQKTEFMAMVGLEQPALEKVITETYKELGLITFFTCGPQEIHAWPLLKGSTAPQAGGEIHSDLQDGFICADIFNYHDLITTRSIAQLSKEGKIRTEGSAYQIQDGDIILIKFNPKRS